MLKRLSLLVCLGVVCLLPGRLDAATRTVCAGGCTYTSLQAAIDAAAYGDTILLRAGETFTGHLVLRAKSGTGTIVIRSDAPASSLPPAGVRLVPSDRPGSNTSRALLPRVTGKGGTWKAVPLLKTEPGARGYVVQYVEFDGAAQLGYETLIQLGEDTAVAPPSDIRLEHVYVHGHRYKGQKRGVTMNGVRLALVDSYVSDIKAVGVDSQAVLGYNGAGPLTIDNNYLEATGENVMFGGADPAIANLVPSNILIRRNHLYKPLSWRNAVLTTPGGVKAAPGSGGSLPAGTHYFRVVAVMATGSQTAVSAPSAQVSATVGAGGSVTLSWAAVAGADKYRVYRGTAAGAEKTYLESSATTFAYKGVGELSGTPPSGGTKWMVKNTFELKNAAKVTVDGNLFENSWQAGQIGYAIMLTPRNGGKAPWTRVQDITFTNNVVRHVAGVVNIAGYDTANPSLRTERITFRNNLFDDVNAAAYGASARAILAGGGPAALVFEGNTFVHTNSAVVYAYGPAMAGFVFTRNLFQHHKYGIVGDGTTTGNPALAKYFPGASVRCNAMAGGTASLYPSPNAFPTVAEWQASFVNFAAGDYRVRAGSPVALSACTGALPGADLAALTAASGGGSPAPAAPAPQPAPTPTPAPDPANQPPVADAGGPYTAAAGALVAVDGTASRDPDGTVLEYRWLWGDEVLVRAADLGAGAFRGAEWTAVDAADAAGGVMILNPDKGAAKRGVAAAPASYVEFTVNVAARVPYYLWMRMKATGNSYNNDSLSVQFSGATTAAGAPLARIGTTSALSVILEQAAGAGVAGWGWSDAAYGGTAAPVYFATSGLQTIRIQQREDGVAWDQLVLSSAAHVAAPGLARNDATFVDAAFGAASGATAAHRYVIPGVYPVLLVVADPPGAVASDTAAVTVR